MPLLLAGLRKNTSLFCFHVAGYARYSVPPHSHDMDKYAGGWMQETERLGYRNRVLCLIRAPTESLPPDIIFELLRFIPNLVPSEDTEGKEAAKDTDVSGKRKRGDECPKKHVRGGE
jgi:hypothetical protein